MRYQRRDSPLHAARAASGCAYTGALVVVVLLFEHPLVLAAALVATLGAAAAAGVLRELRRAAWLGLAMALVIVAINPLVSHQGLTVVFRGGDVAGLGRFDVTLEAIGYGAVLGLRVLLLVLVSGLYTAAVDPDDVLRLFRRISFRSALTAAIATRLVPVLARDGRRMAEAQRCRPGPPPPRLAVVRAVAAGALDRALDVAAALEVRGYGAARRPPRQRRPWSRHDLAFAAAAVALVTLAGGARLSGMAGFQAYPTLRVEAGFQEIALLAALVACALLPFADRRGVAAG